jgi:hypothetical protein
VRNALIEKMPFMLFVCLKNVILLLAMVVDCGGYIETREATHRQIPSPK